MEHLSQRGQRVQLLVGSGPVPCGMLTGWHRREEEGEGQSFVVSLYTGFSGFAPVGVVSPIQSVRSNQGEKLFLPARPPRPELFPHDDAPSQRNAFDGSLRHSA